MRPPPTFAGNRYCKTFFTFLQKNFPPGPYHQPAQSQSGHLFSFLSSAVCQSCFSSYQRTNNLSRALVRCAGNINITSCGHHYRLLQQAAAAKQNFLEMAGPHHWQYSDCTGNPYIFCTEIKNPENFRGTIEIYNTVQSKINAVFQLVMPYSITISLYSCTGRKHHRHHRSCQQDE